MTRGNQETEAINKLKDVVDNHRRQGLNLVKTLTEVFTEAGVDAASASAVAEELRRRARPADASPRRFTDDSTRPNRALQIWLILIGKAANRQIMTYGILAEMMGYGGANPLTQMLGHVMEYCARHRLPPLTVLVVNQGTGLPGDGLHRAEDLNADREKVFNYPWFELVPPTPEEFAQAVAAAGAG